MANFNISLLNISLTADVKAVVVTDAEIVAVADSAAAKSLTEAIVVGQIDDPVQAVNFHRTIAAKMSGAEYASFGVKCNVTAGDAIKMQRALDALQFYFRSMELRMLEFSEQLKQKAIELNPWVKSLRLTAAQVEAERSSLSPTYVPSPTRVAGTSKRAQRRNRHK